MRLAWVRGFPLAGEVLGFGDLLGGHRRRNSIAKLQSAV